MNLPVVSPILGPLPRLTGSAITLLVVPVFYSISVLDLKIVKWEPGKH